MLGTALRSVIRSVSADFWAAAGTAPVPSKTVARIAVPSLICRRILLSFFFVFSEPVRCIPYARWHSTIPWGARTMGVGATLWQRSTAIGQRGLNRQPGGILAGSGIV